METCTNIHKGFKAGGYIEDIVKLKLICLFFEDMFAHFNSNLLITNKSAELFLVIV